MLKYSVVKCDVKTKPLSSNDIPSNESDILRKFSLVSMFVIISLDNIMVSSYLQKDFKHDMIPMKDDKLSY